MLVTRISQTQLVIRSGLSKAIVGELIHGKVRQRGPRTLAAISSALEWHPDHLEYILDGRTPPEAPTTNHMPDVSDWEEILEILREMNRRLIEIHKRIQDYLTPPSPQGKPIQPNPHQGRQTGEQADLCEGQWS
jgi:DNA-binding Xre family transcriptional regulator